MDPDSLPPLRLIEESNLTDWKVIGSGGFGQIYSARDRRLCCNVAIKLLHYDDGSNGSLLREMDMMRTGGSPFVIQVFGVFRGRPPSSGLSVQLGLVMELMERGSLACLQKALRETPPWPLVFRLAHQVALGINFLHTLSPSVLHLDLKPSNVLLDSSLNAKLTDFGLARRYRSTTRLSKKGHREEGGTNSYMPPEAFELTYSPTRASDIYSYGILLWSIVTGKIPYADAISSIVRFRIPLGDRPLLDEIQSQAAGIAGLCRLTNLMEKCWETKATLRPNSQECTTETEELYKMHRHTINDAVFQVLKKLDEKEEEEGVTQQFQRVHVHQASADVDIPTGPPPIQEINHNQTSNKIDGARFKESSQPTNVLDIDPPLVHNSARFSSVHPIQPSLPLSSTRSSHEGRTTRVSQEASRQSQRPIQSENGINRSVVDSQKYDTLPRNFTKSCATGFERQLSSPDTFSSHPPPAAAGVYIHLSHVTGLQHGNNNVMHITLPERKRHPTAPPSVELPLINSGRGRDKKGWLSTHKVL